MNHELRGERYDRENMHPEKPMPEEERDLLGEIFSFRNVLLCAIVLGVLLVVINIFAK